MPMNEASFGEVTAADYDRLADAFDRVATSLDELSVEFTRYRTNARITSALVAFLMFVVLSVVVASVVISRSNAQVIARIDDCTQPGGECYEQSQRRGAERTAPFVELICNATPPERRKPPCHP